MTQQPRHLEPTAAPVGKGPAILIAAILVTLVFVWFIVPETKGKTLEQIEAYWRNGRHWGAAPAAEKPAEPTGVAGR